MCVCPSKKQQRLRNFILIIWNSWSNKMSWWKNFVSEAYPSNPTLGNTSRVWLAHIELPSLHEHVNSQSTLALWCAATSPTEYKSTYKYVLTPTLVSPHTYQFLQCTTTSKPYLLAPEFTAQVMVGSLLTILDKQQMFIHEVALTIGSTSLISPRSKS